MGGGGRGLAEPASSHALLPFYRSSMQRPEGVPDMDAHAAAPCAARPTAVLENARFGFRGVNDLVADALWGLAGLDALSAATATGSNPLQPPSAGAAAAVQLGDRSEAAALVAKGVLERSAALLGALRGLSTDEFQAAAPTIPAPPRIAVAATASSAAAGAAAMAAAGPESAADAAAREERRRLWRGRWFALLQAALSPARRAALFRPGAEPARFVGARPPLRRWAVPPHEDMPETWVWLSTEQLRLGDVPVSAQTHRVIVLRNLRGAAVTLAPPDAPPGDDPATGGVPYGPLNFAWDAVHPLVSTGVVRLHPMAGTIAPGGAVVVRVTFTAPAAAQVRHRLWSCGGSC